MFFRLLKALFLIFLVSAAAGAGTASYIVYEDYWKTLPPVDKLLAYDPPVATRVFAQDGRLIEEFFEERRYLTPGDKIPTRVKQAFIAAEDAEFYSHYGIDPRGMSRAFVANAKAGGVVQGGSTITQQVIKSLLLTPERSYERKLREALLALRIETELTKDEILALYLNQIYLGSGNHGVEAAAKSYFGKDLKNLTLAETAMLAGLPQAPSKYSPRTNPDAAMDRQRYVLRRMLAEGFITSGEYREASRETVHIIPVDQTEERVRNYYTEAVRLHLEQIFGTDAPYSQGYRVYTGMDVTLQEMAERAVRRGLERMDWANGYRGPHEHMESDAIAARLSADRNDADLDELEDERAYEAIVTAVGSKSLDVALGRHTAKLDISKLRWHADTEDKKFAIGDIVRVTTNKPGEKTPKPEPGKPKQLYLNQYPELQAALVAIDLKTGNLVSMVGGYEFLDSQFNRALQAKRQPGSAFKPFVYAAALDNGFTPATIVFDEPIEYDDHGEVWAPQNYSRRFYGPTTVRTALEKSRNVVTVKMVDTVGVRTVVDYMSRFAFDAELGQNLSIGLGTTEVTLMEIVAAYTAFANKGVKIDPATVLKVEDRRGKTLYEGAAQTREALSEQTASLITSMLRGVVERGTARKVTALKRPAAGKTGTSNEQRDAWFIGYTPEYVAGVFVGYDDHARSMGRSGTGGSAAAPIWLDFMQQALEGKPVSDFEQAEGINCIKIDPATGMRASRATRNPLRECFKAGTEPKEYQPLWVWDSEPEKPFDGKVRGGTKKQEEPGMQADDIFRPFGSASGRAFGPARGGPARPEPSRYGSPHEGIPVGPRGGSNDRDVRYRPSGSRELGMPPLPRY